jgi:hypothetical protein
VTVEVVLGVVPESDKEGVGVEKEEVGVEKEEVRVEKEEVVVLERRERR